MYIYPITIRSCTPENPSISIYPICGADIYTMEFSTRGAGQSLDDDVDERSTGAVYHGLTSADEDNGSGSDTKVPLIAMQDDFHRIAGQSFAVISFIDGATYGGARVDGQLCAPMHLFKLRGVFSSKVKAESHAKKCQQLDPYFDVHIVPTFKWTSVGAAMASDTKYANDDVASLMESYFETEDEILSDMQKRMQLNQSGVARSEETSQVYNDAAAAPIRSDYSHDEVGLSFDEMGLEEAAAALRRAVEA
jgi:hypothetical protein